MPITIDNWIRYNDSTTQLRAPVVSSGQSWQNVTSSRSAGTYYTNTTGKQITVALSAWSSAQNGYFYVGSNNVWFGLGRSTYFNTLPVFMVVPVGWQYGNTVGLDYIGAWFELR